MADIFEVISAVQSDLSAVGIQKDRKNAQQGYRFRGIDDVYNTVAPLLAKHRLVIIPQFSDHRIEERESRKGDRLSYAFVRGTFTFYAPDGTNLCAVTYGEAMDSADKATNKAMSAAYKYALMQAFAIPTDADNDADAVTHEVRPARAPAPDTFESPKLDDDGVKRAVQTALIDMAGLVGRGSMKPIQEYMNTLPDAVQQALRRDHKDALRSLKTAVAQAAGGVTGDEAQP